MFVGSHFKLEVVHSEFSSDLMGPPPLLRSLSTTLSPLSTTPLPITPFLLPSFPVKPHTSAPLFHVIHETAQLSDNIIYMEVVHIR